MFFNKLTNELWGAVGIKFENSHHRVTQGIEFKNILILECIVCIEFEIYKSIKQHE